MARILGFGLRHAQPILAAELIGILLYLQHFVTALVEFLAVFEVHAVHNQVIMRRVLSRAFSTKVVLLFLLTKNKTFDRVNQLFN